MRRQEIQHHTTEQIIGYLRDAEQAVRKANIPEKYHVSAFEKACDFYAAKQIIMQEFAPSGIALPANAQTQ